MAEITNPLLNLRIRLPYHLYVRVVVWPDVASLRANTPQREQDQMAIFEPLMDSPCVGTLSFSAKFLGVGTRAHEIEHFIEHFAYRAWDEKRATVVNEVATEIDDALRHSGLI